MYKYLDQLLYKFHADEIEWRILESGIKNDGNIWAKASPYLKNRAIMNRLDQVVGAENWKNEFKEWSSLDLKSESVKIYSCLCGISIRINNEWVTKWDGSQLTSFEPIKGGLSDSMKRAAVQWGIGRYLYDIDAKFVDLITEEQKKSDKSKFAAFNKFGKCKNKEGKYINYYWKEPFIESETVNIVHHSVFEEQRLNNLEQLSGISIDEMIAKLEQRNKNNTPQK